MKYLTEQEAIEAAKAQLDGSLIEFDGQNCDDCAGWDGQDRQDRQDRRCECGNRRVCWETYGNKVEGFTAYATAY